MPASHREGVRAQGFTGNNFLQVCDSVESPYCGPFVSGVLEGIKTQITREAIVQTQKSGVQLTCDIYLDFHNSRMFLCPAESVTIKQIVAVLLKYLERRHKIYTCPQGGGVVSAMNIAFPCS